MISLEKLKILTTLQKIANFCLNATSVTRLGDLLDFGQIFKDFGKNKFINRFTCFVESRRQAVQWYFILQSEHSLIVIRPQMVPLWDFLIPRCLH